MVRFERLSGRLLGQSFEVLLAGARTSCYPSAGDVVLLGSFSLLGVP